MKSANRLLFICAFFSVPCLTFAQKIEVPIKWKIGDTWTYDLKKRNQGGVNDNDRYSRLSFQLKVLAVKPEGKPGYEVEWKYTSYNTFETDTLEDECELIYKRFLFATPFKLRLNENAGCIGFTDAAGFQKKLLDFYAKETKKTANTACYENTKSNIELIGGFKEYMDALAPEIQRFFLGFALLPAEIAYKKDTVEVFKDFLADFNKTIRLPKRITQTASITFANTVEANYVSRVSESDYKKYLVEASRMAWDKLGVEKGSEMRKALEEQLEEFQPKIGDTLHGVFDKNNGSLIQYDYINYAQTNIKGGESTYFYFTRR